MLILLLLFFFFFINPVLSAPTVIINSTPDVIIAGTTFPITFTVEEASSSSSYYYKFFGGLNNDVYSIITAQGLSYTSSWASFPKITLNPDGSNTFNAFAFVNQDATNNVFNLKIRLALISNTKTGATSPPFLIEVASAPPTPNPTPTPIPSPTPTKTPVPTKIPTSSPTSTSTPSLFPSSSPTPIFVVKTPTPYLIDETDIETTDIYISSSLFEEDLKIDNFSNPDLSTESGQILGQKNKNSKKVNFIPIFFITLGGIFLLSPLIISKIKNNEEDN